MKKILAIDGGGIRGSLTAALLAGIESTLPKPIWHYFDLFAGTSTGSLIALSLAAGLPAQRILQFYREKGQFVFPKAGPLTSLKALVRPKRDADRLRLALIEVFGNRRLSDCVRPVIVPTFNLESGSPYIFKTRHHKRLEFDQGQLLVDVAMASTAAPVYFRPHKILGKGTFIDGGVWANNPSVLGAVEAISLLKWKPQQTRLLSIGCSWGAQDLTGASSGKSSAWYWLEFFRKRRLLELMSSAQSDLSTNCASLLLDRPSTIRLQPDRAAIKSIDMDDASKIEQLIAIGDALARQSLPRVKKLFLAQPAKPWKPVPMTAK